MGGERWGMWVIHLSRICQLVRDHRFEVWVSVERDDAAGNTFRWGASRASSQRDIGIPGLRCAGEIQDLRCGVATDWRCKLYGGERLQI